MMTIPKSWTTTGLLEPEFNIVDGKLEGLYREWHKKTRKKRVECTYKNNVLHGMSQVWYEDGQMKEESTYVDGIITGSYKAWHRNGKLSIDVTFVDGQKHGIYRSWHDNGQKYIECTYVNGKLNGTYTIRYYDCDDETKRVYVDDTCMSEETYEIKK